MSGPVFVVDAGGTPLMPMSAAYARKLLREGKAQRLAHSAFTVIQLSRRVEQPTLRPILVALRLHLQTAELFLVADGQQAPQPLMHVIIDLRTDISRRLRRRAGHRRRRRARQRYHALSRHGRPFKLRRPSMARSSWGSALLQKRSGRAQAIRKGPSDTPLFRWRAQAIIRTLNVLRRLIPVSHVFVVDSLTTANYHHRLLTPAEQRERLIRAYGFHDHAGQLTPICAFCQATDGIVEVEHLLPESRGGTDVWENLALACQPCNRRKSDRTPEEAGMTLQLSHSLRSPYKGRLRPYTDGTLRALRGQLRDLGLAIAKPGSAECDSLSERVMGTLNENSSDGQFSSPIVAYPVPRPRKQRFSSRNYPLGTPRRTDMVRVGHSMKRLIRVNASLQLNRANGNVRVQAVTSKNDQEPESSPGTLQIGPGMLGTANRAGSPVTGVVSAIHSSGRLTLRVPIAASSTKVTWQPVVVSPRRDFRVLNADRVVFIRLPSFRGMIAVEAGPD